MLSLNACATSQPLSIVRIALLSPFEGRYRGIGYNAFYAARLAFQDADITAVELLVIDDSGTDEGAVRRAQALKNDPLVEVVITAGFAASTQDAQKALADKPLLVVGEWGAHPNTENSFLLTNAEITSRFGSNPPIGDATTRFQTAHSSFGGELYALPEFSTLLINTQDITIVSSATLPDADFEQQYIHSSEFTPQPSLLATLMYDATRMALQAIANPTGGVANALKQINYEGLNGHIHFENGYWADAPIHCYGYNSTLELVTKDCPIE